MTPQVSVDSTPTTEPGPDSQSLWTFRGHTFDSSHLTNALIHLYRGEMNRANTWRNRLDTTTNWAVVTVGAVLTFSFGDAENPHFVFLLELLLVLTFLYIEARRYQYYVLWAYRVHLIETDFFAAILTPSSSHPPDWADHLAQSLLCPKFPITRWEAVGRRFQRNYIWLTGLLLISWVAKLSFHPTLSTDWDIIVGRAATGVLSGCWVVGIVAVVYGLLIILALITTLPAAWRDTLIAPWKRLHRRLRWNLHRHLHRQRGPFQTRPHPQERLATIITVNGQKIALRILTELGRGVTAMQGTGMYTSEAKDVLLCAVTDIQVPLLEKIIQEIDPHAFFILNATEDIRGWGFRPFEPPS